MNKINLTILACSLIAVSQLAVASGTVATTATRNVAIGSTTTGTQNVRIGIPSRVSPRSADYDSQASAEFLMSEAQRGDARYVKGLLEYYDLNPDATNAQGESFRSQLSTYSPEIQQVFRNFEAQQQTTR